MAWVEHPLPDLPLHAEVVLHVRSVLRRRLRRRRASTVDLALLFDLDEAEERALAGLLRQENVDLFEVAADTVARLRRKEIVDLPSDEAYLRRCAAWLTKRKQEEPAFDAIVATDIASLLGLSTVRELATAEAPPGIGMTPEPIPILLVGETGTGKELVARAIHAIWQRESKSTGLFVPVHVAGMTPALINDELFGHVKGAYTDAKDDRKGRLEEAHGGTLLIDEVGDLPPEAQLRLLRFTQEQGLSRLGEAKVRHVRARIIAATWHPLEQGVAEGTFRRDLFYRLRVGHVRLPPLRERALFFDAGVDDLLRGLKHAAQPPLTREARDALRLQTWEGNLRELVGVLREAMSNAGGRVIRLDDMPGRIQHNYVASDIGYRLPGTLEEPHGSTSPPPEVIRRRVKAASARLAALPLPEPLPALVALRDFLRAVPDADPSHQRTAAAVEKQIGRVQSAGHARRAADVWTYVFNVSSNADVKQHVGQVAQAAHARAAEIQAQALSSSESLGLEEAPWLRFVTELSRLPMFANTPISEVLPGIVMLIRAGYSIAPEMTQEFRAILAKRGLDGIRQEVKRLASESEWTPPAGKAASWSRSDWKDIINQFGSKAEAARVLGINVRTIDRNLTRHRLAWTGRLVPSPPGSRSE